MIERFALPLLVGAAAALALFWWADANGYTRAQAECQRKAQAAADKALGKVDAARRAAFEAELRAAAAGAEVITRFEPIEKEVVRYVERQRAQPVAVPDCLDADGLRIRAAAGAGVLDPAAPAPGAGAALPGLVAGGGIGLRVGPAGQRRGLGEGLSPMPPAPPVAGGVDQHNPGERP